MTWGRLDLPDFSGSIRFAGVPYANPDWDPRLIGRWIRSAVASEDIPFGRLVGFHNGLARKWQTGDPVLGVSIARDPQDPGGSWDAGDALPLSRDMAMFCAWVGLLPPVLFAPVRVASGTGEFTDDTSAPIVARAVHREPPTEESLCLIALNL